MAFVFFDLANGAHIKDAICLPQTISITSSKLPLLPLPILSLA
ncbi:MAG: hypothetical protein ACJATU_000155 [Rickettsiales bacterium]